MTTQVRVIFNCGSRDSCLDLLDRLLGAKGVNAPMIQASIDRGKVIISIYGTKAEAYRVKAALMRAYREWTELRSLERGGGCASINTLVKEVGKPFPREALEEVLKELGYVVRRSGDLLCTDADTSTVLSLASKLSEALDVLVRLKPKSSKSAKNFLTSLAVLTGAGINELLRELSEKGVLTEEGPYLRLTGEWRSLLRKVILGRRVADEDRGKEAYG